MKTVCVGNKLYVRSCTQPSLLEQYRAKQAACPHAKRDPRGTCYQCGHQKVKS
jgi:hypothetical protein